MTSSSVRTEKRQAWREAKRRETAAASEAKTEAKAAAMKARKAAKGISGQQKADFDAERQAKKERYNHWRKEKSKKNKATGGYNGSRKPNRNTANRKNGNETAQEEMDERLDIAIEYIKVHRKLLTPVIADFAYVPDPRHQSYIYYTVPELLMLGLLSSMFNAESRRESNAIMSPVFVENISEFFPEIEKLPHADTLFNFLKSVDADEIEAVKLKLIKRLIKNKTLDPFKTKGSLTFVLDGVHKYTRDYEWCQNALVRRVNGSQGEELHYYAYAVEASILLPGGRTLPVMTEFMDRASYGDCGTDTTKAKQDCETNAAKRLITRLRDCFPCLNIRLAADGLYATGPMLRLCLDMRINPIFVLQEKSLPSVWEEIRAHTASGMCGEKTPQTCNDIGQTFRWVNNIDYSYVDGNKNNLIRLHVAVCNETRIEFDKKTGITKEQRSTFAWVSLSPFSASNVVARCNGDGRSRWSIETQNRIEKHDGYAYTHCFTEDWEAMRAYHFLMQMAYILNTLMLLSAKFAPIVEERGSQRTVDYLWTIFNGAILDYQTMREQMPDKYQLRLPA
jgi:hypothetical protein